MWCHSYRLLANTCVRKGGKFSTSFVAKELAVLSTDDLLSSSKDLSHGWRQRTRLIERKPLDKLVGYGPPTEPRPWVDVRGTTLLLLLTTIRCVVVVWVCPRRSVVKPVSHSFICHQHAKIPAQGAPRLLHNLCMGVSDLHASPSWLPLTCSYPRSPRQREIMRTYTPCPVCPNPFQPSRGIPGC